MLSISVITRGKYGQRLIETLQKHTPFHLNTTSIPETLPEFIEDAKPLVETIEKQGIFNCELLITYSLHPDVTSEIVKAAAENGVKAIIIPGGTRRCDVVQVNKIAKKYNTHIIIEDICCALDTSENQIIKEFTKYLGAPKLDIKTQHNIIKNINILRGAPCGSTWHAAEQILGLTVEEAPAKMGLAVQQYPCRAVRGSQNGIHASARLHKEAAKKALVNREESEQHEHRK
jgi:hypothetical protein